MLPYLFLDLAAALLARLLPVHVGDRRQLGERWLLGIFKAESEYEESADEHDTDGYRVLELLQQQAHVHA